MKKTTVVWVIAGCLSGFGQQKAEQPVSAAGSVTIRAGVNEVLLDIVVRDKKGSARDQSASR